MSYFTERVPSRGEREIWFELQDGSSPTNSRRVPYVATDIPFAIQAEEADVFVQGDHVATHRGQSVIPTGSVTVLQGSFLDASQPTFDEIIGQTGEGANWTPTNDTINAPVDEEEYHLYTARWHNDARKMGGSYTIRTCTGVLLKRPASSSVAGPTTVQYSIKVYGTITDSVVSTS